MYGPLINPPPGGPKSGDSGDPLIFGWLFAVFYWLIVFAIIGGLLAALFSIGEQISRT